MINLRTSADKRREWLAQLRLSQGFARGIADRLKREFDAVGKAAATAFREHGHHAVDAATKEHPANVRRILVSAYVAIGIAFARRTIGFVKKDKGLAHVLEKKDTEDEVTFRVTSFAQRTAGTKVVDITRTTQRRINDAITRGVADGDTPGQIADSIYESTGGSIGEFRAEAIARTESHSAAENASLESIKAMGLSLTKEWIATSDDRTRDDHSEANGQEAPLEGFFTVGDDELAFPGDPDGSPEEIINCRCAMVFNNIEADPVIEETP